MSAPFFKDVWRRPWKPRKLIRNASQNLELFDSTGRSICTMNHCEGRAEKNAALLAKTPLLLTAIDRLMTLIQTQHEGDLDNTPEMVEARALREEITQLER